MSTEIVRPATTYPVLVGNVLQALRKQKDIQQGALADRIGISQSTWSRIERGESALTVEQLSAAAEALGVVAGDILAYADRAAEEARRQGIVVQKNRVVQEPNPGLVLIGAAAVALIVIAVLAKAR